MRQSPRAGAACPALLRSRASIMRTMSSSGILPVPISTRVPTMFRTMWRRNPSRLDSENDHPRCFPVQGNVHHGPHPVLHLALGRAEGVEVMGAQKGPCRPYHGREVERVTDMPASAPVQRRPDGAVEDPVMVDFAAGVIPRVEFPGHLAHFLHHDIRGKKAVHAQVKIPKGELRGRAEIRHLVQGMNPRVGPARGNQDRPVVDDPGNAVLHHLLDGEDIGLPLPAVVGGPVVFDDELDVSHVPRDMVQKNRFLKMGDPRNR